MLTIEDLAKKRRELWEKEKNCKRDKELVDAIARKILETKDLREEVQKKPYLSALLPLSTMSRASEWSISSATSRSCFSMLPRS